LDAEQRLRVADRLEVVGQLAAGVAHDFNNLLFAIGGSLELIGSATRTNDRVQMLVERGRGAAERGSRLVSSLLGPVRPWCLSLYWGHDERNWLWRFDRCAMG
jgi:signal transduction histidine kinase